MKNELLDLKDVPRVTEWVTLPELSTRTGASRQTVHKWMVTKKLATVHKLGPRPVYVITAKEAKQIVEGKHSMITFTKGDDE